MVPRIVDHRMEGFDSVKAVVRTQAVVAAAEVVNFVRKMNFQTEAVAVQIRLAVAVGAAQKAHYQTKTVAGFVEKVTSVQNLLIRRAAAQRNRVASAVAVPWKIRQLVAAELKKRSGRDDLDGCWRHQ